MGVLCAGLFSSCAFRQTPLHVSVFKLKDDQARDQDHGMSRGEQLKYLYGAVTKAEKMDRIGEYYNVDWVLPESDTGLAKVVFSYQLAGTASQVHRRVCEYPAEKRSGSAEFRHTGNDYVRYGRVLAWKLELFAGSRLCASKQSYMWQ